MSQLSVRFVSDGDPAGAGPPTRQTVSIHVGALRLEGSGSGVRAIQPTPPSPPPPLPGTGDDVSGLSSISEDATNETQVEEELLKSSTRSPKLSWDLLLLILFSGSGWGLLAVLLGLLFLFGVPAAMIIIGALFLGIESCYDERIAILLIIGGVLSIFSVLTRATISEEDHAKKRRRHRHHRHLWDEAAERPPPKKSISWVQIFHGLITFVDCVWMVVTSIFVYSIWSDVELDDVEGETYCARTLYLFSFIYLTVVWTLFGISLLFLSLKLLLASCVCAWKGDNPGTL